MDNVKKLIIDKQKPNSYEFGKASNRHKVYYNTIEELTEHIQNLKNAGLYE